MHQGEAGKATYDADTGVVGANGSDSAANYAKAARKIYDDLCEDLGLEPGEVKFLAGEPVNSNLGLGYSNINAIPGAFNDLPNTAFVISSKNLTWWSTDHTFAGGDNETIHFSFDGYKELGKRYGDKMLELLY